MGDDLYGRIVEQRGSFPNLLSRIPLLGDKIESYFDMDAQRDADRIIREHITGLLRQQRTDDAEEWTPQLQSPKKARGPAAQRYRSSSSRPTRL